MDTYELISPFLYFQVLFLPEKKVIFILGNEKLKKKDSR